MPAKTKKKTTKKSSAKKRVRKGSKYSCRVCGLAVKIDEVCGCVDMCDIVCCDTQMKPKRA
jgi:hypothetical protein